MDRISAIRKWICSDQGRDCLIEVEIDPYFPILDENPSNKHDREHNNGDTHNASYAWGDSFYGRRNEGVEGDPKQD
ncbi:MAG: hypothetical protein E2O74_04400 [Chloroflexi bacterium]|nr:MAG: hypothetical protein E2O74_04400 [Chloroflexota bacterium]